MKKVDRIIKKCKLESCNKEFKVRNTNSGNKKNFCSLSCFAKYTHTNKIPWNKGLTKETNLILKNASINQSKTRKNNLFLGKDRIWSQGLTKETDERLKIASEKSSKTRMDIKVR